MLYLFLNISGGINTLKIKLAATLTMNNLKNKCKKTISLTIALKRIKYSGTNLTKDV